MNRQDHILGCILGTAVGDAIGLPREGLSARRAGRMFGGPPLGYRFMFGRGMCSDDTEHTVMVGQALIASDGDAERFASDFARRLRWWFARVPAGIGFGTCRACVKLWIGVSPTRSGVKSAGNGPAMRSAVLGVAACNEAEMQRLVEASTAVTHADPRAGQGAAVIARLARWASTPAEERGGFEAALFMGVEDIQLRSHLELAVRSAEAGLTPDAFARQLDQQHGISGFVNHTVPAAVYSWLANRGSYRDAVEAAVCLGGDSDTVAAITGALAGTELGPDAIPQEWIAGLREWPCGVEWMKRLSQSLSDRQERQMQSAPEVHGFKMIVRNAFFTAVVLTHGMRRLFPPY